MSTKSLLSISILSSVAWSSCFAQAFEIQLNEPADIDLGMKIDMQGRDFLKKITVDTNKFLLINQNLTDVRVVRDKTRSFNQFHALVAYNLYVNSSKMSPTQFLYVQCPVTRVTTLDRSKPATEQVIDGVTHLLTKIDIDTLKTEVLDVGSYSFLSLPKEKVPPLSKNFPMVGKVNQHFNMQTMCYQIELAYSQYRVDKLNRYNILKQYGISE